MSDRKVVPFQQSGSFYFNQGLKKVEQNNKKEALKHFKKAFETDNSNLSYLSQYVYLLADNGRHAEAEHILINHFIQHHYDAEFYYILSQLYIIMNDPNKAFLFGMEYVKHYPEDDYQDELERLFDVAVEDENEVESEAERFVGHHIFQHLFMNARIEEALDFLSAMPVEIQEEREFRNLKAMAYLFLNQFDEAGELLEQLLKENKTDMHALSHMTLLYYHTGEEEKYQRYLKKLEVVQPLDDDDRFKVGLVLSFLRKYDRAYELLMPLYKNQQFVSFQLLHALSHASFYTGKPEESKLFWERMQQFHRVDVQHSPWVKNDAMVEIERLEHQFLDSDDTHERLLGLYKIHRVEPKEAILGHNIWTRIEGMEDYEKLYVTFLFQGLKLVRLGRMHAGLEALTESGYNSDEDLLQWIDTFHDIYERIGDFEDTGALVAANLYLFQKGRKFTKSGLCREFEVTNYKLNKAIGMIEQN
ncbi:tetratricopeptide repeat protein [Corticicoccus populi]|uniref:Tetratricopeptide repeat protein n=1 Tax=Corticicoccus populi TaxID=1812821 RepID=A0ABW5WXZ6_9STAP